MALRTIALVSALAFAAAAQPVAAAEYSGRIANLDLAQNRMTLDNGAIYKLAPGQRTPELRVGDRVKVEWTREEGGFHYAEKLTVIAKADTPPPGEPPATPSAASAPSEGVAVGRVTNLDRAQNRITLENGQMFQISPGQRPDSLTVGDTVQVQWRGYQDKGFMDAYVVTPLNKP